MPVRSIDLLNWNLRQVVQEKLESIVNAFARELTRGKDRSHARMHEAVAASGLE